MKCQKCGVEIPEGKLYCENCGEEITIVPLFEPELETQIDESLHKISEEVLAQTTMNTPKSKKKPHYLGMVVVLVVISLFIGVIALIYLFNSPLYQLNQGNKYVSEENYQKAIVCYEKALLKNPENPVDIYLYMVNCYEKLGYDGQYEEYLLRAIADSGKTQQQELTAYTKLIQFYREGNSFQTINNLLKNCKSDKIRERFKDYLVSTPVFHYEEGTYQEIIPLKITSPEGYEIYYTLDGSEPTKDSNKYSEPIFLDDGNYEFRAVCINEFGVSSDVVIKKYEVIFANK